MGWGDSNQSIDFHEFRELAILSATDFQVTKYALNQILENYLQNIEISPNVLINFGNPIGFVLTFRFVQHGVVDAKTLPSQILSNKARQPHIHTNSKTMFAKIPIQTICIRSYKLCLPTY